MEILAIFLCVGGVRGVCEVRVIGGERCAGEVRVREGESAILRRGGGVN